jgi:hypothetical protein
VEYEVVVEKVLEVGEQYRIVKHFVIEGVQNTSIAIAILALFLFSSKFQENENSNGEYKELYLC